jgi:hypothetical protein
MTTVREGTPSRATSRERLLDCSQRLRKVVTVSVDPTIAGVVVDARGDPVEGARVYVERAPVPVPDRATLTDRSGRFELWAPSTGTYHLGVASEGPDGTVYETTRVDVGEVDRVDLEVRLGALR